jgi:hypothetical protein
VPFNERSVVAAVSATLPGGGAAQLEDLVNLARCQVSSHGGYRQDDGTKKPDLLGARLVVEFASGVGVQRRGVPSHALD